ncbi:ComEC/Rec2 family competence protein [Rubrobacter aplysinae]|uniref:ComEC/Rec2 family competence protein n=1 Tax=Rubrobacter aplysinae TaxID=909625 RepID=UPI00069D03A1|nr:ComEC/Rec2 family competence protein [Rubrobacter aplysinae]
MSNGAYARRGHLARVVAAVILMVTLLGLPSGCGALAVGPATAEPPPSGALVLSFIDVGQGGSTLVQSGGESFLIDAGRPEEGPEVVDFLRSRGVEELDGLVVTHPDADHIGGVPEVLGAMPVQEVYVSDRSPGGSLEAAFLEAVEEEEAELTEVGAGDELVWGASEITVLSPPEGGFSEDNDNSVATLIEHGPDPETGRVLLTGDAEARAEEYMSQGPETGPLAVLKVGHHGSSTSTTPLFLSRFRPQVAVISVGEDNGYGHPTPQTLRRLRTVGSEVFRTDEQGDVIVTLHEGELEVAVSGDG